VVGGLGLLYLIYRCSCGPKRAKREADKYVPWSERNAGKMHASLSGIFDRTPSKRAAKSAFDDEEAPASDGRNSRASLFSRAQSLMGVADSASESRAEKLRKFAAEQDETEPPPSIGGEEEHQIVLPKRRTSLSREQEPLEQPFTRSASQRAEPEAAAETEEEAAERRARKEARRLKREKRAAEALDPELIAAKAARRAARHAKQEDDAAAAEKAERRERKARKRAAREAEDSGMTDVHRDAILASLR
jgi:hypothetical protein